MTDRSQHLSHTDLMQFIDSECSPAQAASTRDHLQRCPECLARLATAEATLNDVNALYTSQTSESVPSTAARARLQQQLTSNTRHPRIHVMQFSRWATAALLLVVAGFALYGVRHGMSRKSADYVSVPNHSLTPGAVRPVTVNDICPTSSADADDDNDADLDPTLPASTQNAVLQEYGLAPASPQTYQIDYLVNPQLGGTSDIKNLWPQPYRQGSWNAVAKDELEKHLHRLVCERAVDLTVAQREIETDWIAAYKKYLHPQPPA